MLDNPNDPLRHPFGPRELAEIADSLAALPCGHVEDPLPLLNADAVCLSSGNRTFICSTTRPCGPIPMSTEFSVHIGEFACIVLLRRLPREYERVLTDAQIDDLFDFMEMEVEWWSARGEEADQSIEGAMRLVSEALEDRIAEMTEGAAR